MEAPDARASSLVSAKMKQSTCSCLIARIQIFTAGLCLDMKPPRNKSLPTSALSYVINANNKRQNDDTQPQSTPARPVIVRGHRVHLHPVRTDLEVGKVVGVHCDNHRSVRLQQWIHPAKKCDTSADHVHHYGMWTNLGRNGLNDMWQARYCTNCGMVQEEIH